MRFIAILSLCLLPSTVQAKPSRYPPVTQFNGDRYVSVAQGGTSAPDVLKAVKRKSGAKARHPTRHKKPRRRPVQPGVVTPLTMAGGFRREVGRAVQTVRGHFIRGRLVCAANVGQELARRGIKGTGSRLAKSYLSWGRASPPVPGAVAVFDRGRRGGHVAIVHKVLPNGTVIYLNPSSRRQAWVIGPYRKRPIAFRVAG